MAFKDSLREAWRTARDPFDTDFDYEGEKKMEEKKRNTRTRTTEEPAPARKPRRRVDLNPAYPLYIQAVYPGGNEVKITQDEMNPGNKTWIDFVQSLPSTVPTARFWIHKSSPLDSGYYYSDEQLLADENEGRAKPFKNAEEVANALGYRWVYLQVYYDEGEPGKKPVPRPIRDERNQFIIVDSDPRLKIS